MPVRKEDRHDVVLKEAWPLAVAQAKKRGISPSEHLRNLVHAEETRAAGYAKRNTWRGGTRRKATARDK